MKKQDPKFIKSLTKAEQVVGEITGYLYMMVNYFEQYTEAVKSSPLFAIVEPEEKNDGVSNAPTQTVGAMGADSA